MANKYDIVSIGHITHDIRNMMGDKTFFTGGAAYFSPFAAKKTGANIKVITKMAKEHQENLDELKDAGIEVQCYDSPKTTCIENIFASTDQDDRVLELVDWADKFSIADVPAEDTADVYHVATLLKDEMPDSMLEDLAKRGKVALDVQSCLRNVNGKEIFFKDWEGKEKYLPSAYYIKADSLESKEITGLDSREDAAKKIYEWSKGNCEIMITRKDEVIIYDGEKVYKAPFNAKNLDGRAGRGDTCFISYISRRLTHNINDSLHYAAALTSLKMEAPKPFDKEIADVEERMKEQAY